MEVISSEYDHWFQISLAPADSNDVCPLNQKSSPPLMIVDIFCDLIDTPATTSDPSPPSVTMTLNGLAYPVDLAMAFAVDPYGRGILESPPCSPIIQNAGSALLPGQTIEDVIVPELRSRLDRQGHREARRRHIAPYRPRTRLKEPPDHQTNFRLLEREAEITTILGFETAKEKINGHRNLSSGQEPYEREKAAQVNFFPRDYRREEERSQQGKTRRHDERVVDMDVIHHLHHSSSNDPWVLTLPKHASTPMGSKAEADRSEPRKKARQSLLSYKRTGAKDLMIQQYQPKR